MNITGSLTKGGASIVVEGIDKDGQRFVRQFDIKVRVVEETVQDIIQSSLGKYQGYVSEIRESERYSYLPGPGPKPETWLREPDKVEAMMENIREQRRKVEEGDIFRLRVAGAWQSGCLRGNSAHDCLAWTEEKLKIAAAGSWRTTTIESIEATSDSRARSCIIL
ncbi:MAG: hypothetical protein HYZ47_00340 [Simkania negevensis]|nr:hypothetical protein [Simkania negevensis]